MIRACRAVGFLAATAAALAALTVVTAAAIVGALDGD